MALLCQACARREPTLVFVDLGRIPGPAAPSPAVAEARSGSAVPAQTVVLPGAEVRSYLLPSLEQRRRAAVETLRDLEEQTRRLVAARLRAIYWREIEQLLAERRAELEDLSRRLSARVDEGVSLAFARYAERQGEALAEIALTAGFPDDGLEPPDEPGAWARRQRERLAAARAEREAAVREFRGAVAELAAEATREYADAAGRLAVELERLRAEADRRAEEQARGIARGYGGGVRSLLAGADKAVAPGLPARSQQLPAVQAGPALGPGPDRVPRGVGLRAALQLWAGWNGYKLTDDPRQGRDATEEFAGWLDAMRPR
ncbi:MAG: hypothetical protein N2109_09830 [Fimbriimonadales bacterium]|nr:hypothetical protein [Fimbriimonadales bacterium]